MLYLFKVRKLGAFFGPWMTIQDSGSTLLCDIISGFPSRTKTNKQRDSFFFFYRVPDSCIVFGCNNKSEGNGRALHGIPFLNNHRPELVKRRKKWIDFVISHCLCLFRASHEILIQLMIFSW